MGEFASETTSFRRALAAAVALGAMVAGIAIASSDASAARVEASKLGRAKGKVSASCPKTPCEAIGSVTGFQKRAAGRRGIFKVPEAAKIVGWSIDISKPSPEQRSFFGSFYEHDKLGTDPLARLAVLRRKPKKDGRFKLRKQSPKVALEEHLGTRPLFTLNRPLGVAKGDVIGITVPTWAPIFDVDLSERNSWVASRSPDKCSGVDNIKSGRPQQKPGSLRRYGCTYSTARLAYWAYYVPKDGGGKKKKSSKKS